MIFCPAGKAVKVELMPARFGNNDAPAGKLRMSRLVEVLMAIGQIGDSVGMATAELEGTLFMSDTPWRFWDCYSDCVDLKNIPWQAPKM